MHNTHIQGLQPSPTGNGWIYEDIGPALPKGAVFDVQGHRYQVYAVFRDEHRAYSSYYTTVADDIREERIPEGGPWQGPDIPVPVPGPVSGEGLS